MSGGRSTVANAKGKRLAAQAGDLSCIHPVGALFASKFISECKNYRDLQYKGLITGKGCLVTFWGEAKKQGIRYGKHPILIAKQNQMPIVVCLDKKGSLDLDLQIEDTIIFAPKLDLRIYLLDDFLKKAIPP